MSSSQVRSKENPTEYAFSVTNQAERLAESPMICPLNYEIVSQSLVKILQESTLRVQSIPVLIINRIYNCAQARREYPHLTAINSRTSALNNCIIIDICTDDGHLLPSPQSRNQTVPSQFV